MSSDQITPRRTIVYVDGFNLYFGLVAAGWRGYLWLNLAAFAASILRDGQQLSMVKYFTSRITGPVEKQKRQNAYLTAVRTLSGVQIIEGRYQSDKVMCQECSVQIQCPKCHIPWHDNNEKMTDVNIATHMFEDAYKGRMDDAILITGDADQRPTIDRVRRLFSKRVLVCFPPKRQSYDLKAVADDTFSAREENYRKSQFPQVVDLPGGHTIVKPSKWTHR